MEFAQTLLRLLKALSDYSVEYILIGGAALNLHGLVRATEDIDLFISPDASNIERLKTALRSVWNDASIDEISAEELCGDYPALRYGPPTGSIYLDILTRLGETSYSDLEAEDLEIDGIRARVATPRTLYRMKAKTVRPIDHADARALADAFDFGDDDAD